MLTSTTQEERIHQKHLNELREELIAAVASNDHPRIGAVVLTGAAKIDEPTRGMTALMEIVAFQKEASVESVRLLLAGSDPLARDSNGATALMLAIKSGRLDLAALLLPVSDVKARDEDGNTALMHAYSAKARDMWPWLIAASDPNAVNRRGWNALMLASFTGNLDFARQLLPASDARASSTEGDSGVGWTALMLAAHAGHAECVELLLPVSDPKAQGTRGETALLIAIEISIATERSRAECADRLAEHSDPEEARLALATFGPAAMPKYSRYLAQREAEDIRQSMEERAGATENVDSAEKAAKVLAPPLRAPSKRL